MAIDSRDLARRINSDDDLTEDLKRFESLPSSQTESVLVTLADDRSPIVRAWVTWAAGRYLAERGGSLLVRLAADRDADVRSAALEQLLALDMDLTRTLLPRIRRMLRSKDYYEPITALWAAARLKDSESLPLVRSLVENSDRDPWQRRAASAVALLLEGGPQAVAAALKGHDHLRTRWLVHALVIAGTTEARTALADFAESAPDEECSESARRGALLISEGGAR